LEGIVIYYFLPGRGLYGGVKVAIQFMELLSSLGVKIVAVLPDGRAPQWFVARAATLAEAQVWPQLKADDWMMITWPPDYERLRDRGRLICHCQGTDDRMDPIFADHSIPILSCWSQADDYVRQVHGRSTVRVGIAISDCFFLDGRLKWDNRVAYMPRRGWGVAKACMNANRNLDYQPIDGLDEIGVSRCLKASGIYLATSLGEQFGLPALEAMAAGCAVISVPVKGGLEYLKPGFNCLLGEPEELPQLLTWLTEPAQEKLRHLFRARALASAQPYRLSRQHRELASLLKGELSWLNQR
jgi:glycosyltransferase involved in cell wall biosynthesis